MSSRYSPCPIVVFALYSSSCSSCCSSWICPFAPCQDLLDYLSQLLGDDGDDVKSLVRSIGKFQRGETIEAGNTVNSVQSDTTKPTKSSPPSRERQDEYIAAKTPTGKANNSAGPTASVTRNRKPQQQKQQQKTNQLGNNNNSNNKNNNNTKKKNGANSIKARQQTSLPPSLPSKQTKAATKKQAPAQPLQQAQKRQASNNGTKEKAAPPTKSRPPKGKAAVVCGCFGTVHKPLTNCLHCGRIACEREGYDYCPFCGYLLEQVGTGAGRSVCFILIFVCLIHFSKDGNPDFTPGVRC